MAKNTEKKQRYVVAPGASFVGSKRAYVAGDDIDESAFSKPEHFKKFLSSKPPKIIPAPPKDDEDEKKAGKETGKNEERKALEAKAIEAGLLNQQDAAALDDEALKNLLQDNGL